jgi:hypothetical protein
MIYGAKAVAALPWSPGGWKLLACAALKSPPPAPDVEPAGHAASPAAGVTPT